MKTIHTLFNLIFFASLSFSCVTESWSKTFQIQESDHKVLINGTEGNKFLYGDLKITFRAKNMFGTSKYILEVSGSPFIAFSKISRPIDVKPELKSFEEYITIKTEGNYVLRILKPNTKWNSDLSVEQSYDTLAVKEFNLIPEGLYFCRSIDNTNTEKGISNYQPCGRDINLMINNSGKPINLCYMVIYELLPGREKGLYGLYEMKDIKKGVNKVGSYQFPCGGSNEYIISFKMKKDGEYYFWERSLYIH